MPDVIKTRWLVDHDQNKIAPKTLSSQVINEDGTLFKDTVQTNLDTLSNLVGTTPVATQISNALGDISAITTSEIDAICGATIQATSEVLL